MVKVVKENIAMLKNHLRVEKAKARYIIQKSQRKRLLSMTTYKFQNNKTVKRQIW